MHVRQIDKTRQRKFQGQYILKQSILGGYCTRVLAVARNKQTSGTRPSWTKTCTVQSRAGMPSPFPRAFIKFMRGCSLGIGLRSNLAYLDHPENIRQASTIFPVTQPKHFKDKKHS